MNETPFPVNSFFFSSLLALAVFIIRVATNKWMNWHGLFSILLAFLLPPRVQLFMNQTDDEFIRLNILLSWFCKNASRRYNRVQSRMNNTCQVWRMMFFFFNDLSHWRTRNFLLFSSTTEFCLQTRKLATGVGNSLKYESGWWNVTRESLARTRFIVANDVTLWNTMCTQRYWDMNDFSFWFFFRFRDPSLGLLSRWEVTFERTQLHYKITRLINEFTHHRGNQRTRFRLKVSCHFLFLSQWESPPLLSAYKTSNENCY